ncbi:MAG: D-glycerate dehydrogenase, partial [Chloroflexi bacterium]|nr:D-glycerate dehydrogenase [Chloroflexota bacterium]
MTKPKVFVTREIPDKGLDLVKEFCDADIWPHEIPPARAELVARVRDVDGLLSML